MKNKVLVYQMGKVGSLAVRKALIESRIPVSHVHRIAAKQSRHWHIKEYTHIISLVRDPVARNISEFTKREYPHPTKLSGPQLAQKFIRDHNHGWPLIWWGCELIPVVNFDFFRLPFDHSKGHATYQLPTSQKLLILQTEKLALEGHRIIGDFLGISLPPIPLFNRTGDTQSRAALHSILMQHLTLPKDLLDLYYENNTTRYFYSAAQIAAFRGRW